MLFQGQLFNTREKLFIFLFYFIPTLTKNRGKHITTGLVIIKNCVGKTRLRLNYCSSGTRIISLNIIG